MRCRIGFAVAAYPKRKTSRRRISIAEAVIPKEYLSA